MIQLALLPSAVVAGVPKVVTDFAPVDSLVTLVTGTPAMLLPAVGDPHDFQSKPAPARAPGRGLYSELLRGLARTIADCVAGQAISPAPSRAPGR